MAPFFGGISISNPTPKLMHWGHQHGLGWAIGQLMANAVSPPSTSSTTMKRRLPLETPNSPPISCQRQYADPDPAAFFKARQAAYCNWHTGHGRLQTATAPTTRLPSAQTGISRARKPCRGRSATLHGHPGRCRTTMLGKQHCSEDSLILQEQKTTTAPSRLDSGHQTPRSNTWSQGLSVCPAVPKARGEGYRRAAGRRRQTTDLPAQRRPRDRRHLRVPDRKPRLLVLGCWLVGK